LCFPLGFSSLSTFDREFFTSGLRGSRHATATLLFCLCLGHEDLFVLVRDNTFLLTIKLFALLLEDLVANADMLVIGLIIEVAAAIRALMKVHFRRFWGKSISTKVAALVLKSRQDL
jgi:hypothetical protein